MNDYHRAQIVDMYNIVMSQIIGGKVFGETVIPEDPQLLVVAAYLYGAHKSDLENMDDIDRLTNFIRNGAVKITWVDRLVGNDK